MNTQDLGPLERAVLEALLLAEQLRAGFALPTIWRALPEYGTHLANVREALADGAPLRNWVISGHGLYVLQDRKALLRNTAQSRRRAEERWTSQRAVVRGLCKLPWIEAVAVAGPMAWGVLHEDGEPLELVVIAEGGRADLARGSLMAYRQARGAAGATLRVREVLDADRLERPAGSRVEAFDLLGLRPVMNADAFRLLAEANPWMREHFPNFGSDSAGGLPDYGLGARFDGRLAAVRRRLVTAAEDGGVLLRSAARRAGLWHRVENRLSGRLAIMAPAPVGLSGSHDREDRLAQRREVLAEWSFEVAVKATAEAQPAPAPAAKRTERRAADEPAKAEAQPKPAAQPEAPVKPKAAAKPKTAAKKGKRRGTPKPIGVDGVLPGQLALPMGPRSPSPSSTASAPPVPSAPRQRGPARRPNRERPAAAAGETGQRGRGSRRRKSTKVAAG